MSFAIDFLNSIRQEASAEYQERIPVATQENITEIGNSFKEYKTLYNEYSSALMYKIGLTILQTNSFENKLKRFKSGKVVTGQDVEEIFVDQFREAEGSYDPTGLVINPFKRREYNDVKVHYHRMNRQDKYVISINRLDHIRAFRSESTLSEFYAAQFNSLYTGAEYDEWCIMKKMLGEISEDAVKTDALTDDNKTNIVYYVNAPTTKTNAESFVKTVKKAIKDIGYPTTNYNPSKVKTKTDKNKLVLFAHKDLDAHLSVDLYSQIFGPGYAQLGIEIVEVDDFGPTDNGTLAILADDKIFKIWDVLNEMEELRNPDSLVTNYWYHVWQILSTSKFKNRIVFKTGSEA